MRLVTICEVNDAIIHVSDIVVLSVCFKLIYFFSPILPLCNLHSHQIFTNFTLHCSHYLYYFGLFCNHCSLVCFHWSKNHKHPSSNYGTCCFCLCRPRLFLVEFFILSLMFYQALVMSSTSFSSTKLQPIWDFNLIIFPNLHFP